MNLLETLLNIEDVRQSAAEMRAAYADLSMPVELEDAALVEGSILENLEREGPMSSRHLRMGGAGGVISTSEALVRLARAGQIEADAEGNWRLSK